MVDIGKKDFEMSTVEDDKAFVIVVNMTGATGAVRTPIWVCSEDGDLFKLNIRLSMASGVMADVKPPTAVTGNAADKQLACRAVDKADVQLLSKADDMLFCNVDNTADCIVVDI